MNKLLVDIKKHVENFSLDISFECTNETLGILGASGCGKSMTLRSIAGIFKPDEGLISLDGQALFDSTQHINLKPQKRHIGYLFQNYQLFPSMTTVQNICAGMPKEYNKSEITEELDKYIDFFQLCGLEVKYPNKLSGGQQQRVALARMFASKPKALMLDEPFSALDAHLKASLYPGLLRALDSFKGPKLYVSHDIEEAYMFCDKLLVLDSGKVTDFGNSDRVIKKPHSLAALKLSGITNIAEIVSQDTAHARTKDTDLALQINETLQSTSKYVGIANSKIGVYEEKPEGIEVYPYKIIYVSEGLYSKELVCRLVDNSKENTGDPVELEEDFNFSIVRLDLEQSAKRSQSLDHLRAGDMVWLEFRADHLLYVDN